jgi:hypothetical protein
MNHSRFILLALSIGLALAGGSVLDRAWQGELGEDEDALPQVVSVDVAPSVQARPVSFDRARVPGRMDFSHAAANPGLAERGVRGAGGGGRTLLSLHTLLIE